MSLKILEHAKECGLSLGEFAMLETIEHEELQCLCMDYMNECAKLRELVRDMWRSCPAYTADCYGCEFHIDGGCKLYDRMRELGIEVDA